MSYDLNVEKLAVLETIRRTKQRLFADFESHDLLTEAVLHGTFYLLRDLVKAAIEELENGGFIECVELDSRPHVRMTPKGVEFLVMETLTG